MNWLEQKYISLVSYRLRNFKRKTNNTYNFSCPICMDSKTNALKARGYIYVKKGEGRFHCHNCGETMSIPWFLKTVDPGLYQQFQLERLKETNANHPTHQFVEKIKGPIFNKEGILKSLQRVSQLHHNDPVKQLVVQRKIPNEFHYQLYKCDKFKKFTNSLIPDKFDAESLSRDSTRLIIPFLNVGKECFGYQGRSIDSNDTVRYISIILDDGYPKIYGLDRVDPNKKTYVFEGPIDSMFIDNGIATAGGDMVSTLVAAPIEKQNLILCYDNEKHSKQTIVKINKAIEQNYKVLIYPDTFPFKDINEAILGGWNTSDLHFILERNTFQGLSAMARLASYSKA